MSWQGELIINQPMSEFTSFKVGGLADKFYKPVSIEDAAAYLASVAADEPVYWLGLGSNLLVRDGGLRGSVISTRSGFNQLERLDSQRIQVGVGVPAAKVARFALRNGLLGGEFLIGIPGSMGGALAMNAGAWGGETWPLVESVVTLNHQGQLQQRKAETFGYSYRSVTGLENEWFVSAVLKLSPGDGQRSAEKIKQLMDERAAKQPIGLPSCGSTFRNPQGDHAGRLIEAAGLKGYSIGGAQVSDKHANFIINANNASATDIESLIEYVQQQVQQQFAVSLQPEVKIIGEAM